MRTIVWRKLVMEDILGASWLQLPARGREGSASFRAVTDRGELLRQAAAERRHEREQAQRRVAQRANRAWGRGQSGEPVGKRDHAHGFLTAAGRVLVELVLPTVAQCDGERIP